MQIARGRKDGIDWQLRRVRLEIGLNNPISPISSSPSWANVCSSLLPMASSFEGCNQHLQPSSSTSSSPIRKMIGATRGVEEEPERLYNSAEAASYIYTHDQAPAPYSLHNAHVHSIPMLTSLYLSNPRRVPLRQCPRFRTYRLEDS